MTGADVITVVVCVFFGAGALSLVFAEPIANLRQRRSAQVEAVNQVLASPIKLPVTQASRAMRARRANVVWSLPACVIADKLGPYDAELADLQPLADLLLDAEDDAHHW